MKTIYLGNTTEEWLLWRSQGIGASDIPVIMGTNRFSSLRELWASKVNFKKGPHKDKRSWPAIKHGIDNEPKARKWAEERFGMDFLTDQYVEYSEEPIFRASLDGWAWREKCLVEVKCPFSDEVLDRTRRENFFFEEWLDQVQWQLLVTDAERAILVVYDHRDGEACFQEVHHCPERQEKMIEKAYEFWKSVMTRSEPPAQPSDYIDLGDQHELQRRLQRMEELKKVKEQADKERAEEVEWVVKHYGYRDFLCGGHLCTRVCNHSSLDKDQMRKDGIDLQRYMKPPKNPFHLRFSKRSSRGATV